jgi:MarR family transcriptional regulator, negative regulator of the multidrug operon emrRAB
LTTEGAKRRRRAASGARVSSGARIEDLFEARARLVVSEHMPEADLDAMAVLYNLLRTAARVVHDLETNVHRPFGHTWASFRVLFNVWVAGPISPQELARLSSVSRASISSVLNTLEEKGLVARTRNTTDRRAVEVELTHEGRSHMIAYWARHNDREREWAAALGPVQRRALIDALHALYAHNLPETISAPDSNTQRKTTQGAGANSDAALDKAQRIGRG